MKNKVYRLNDRLANLYEEVRIELGFDLSLSSLMMDTDVWETDVRSSMKKACRHLFKANNSFLDATKRTDQILLAELYIRDLVEHLQGELAAYPAQIVAAVPMHVTRLSRGNRRHDGFESTISTLTSTADDEDCHCRFSRAGTDVDVTVDHDTDTNFFADISYDLRKGGLFVATYNILEVGTCLNVRLVLPGKYVFILMGKVSWVRETDNCADDVSPGMGITFDKLSREPSKAIRQFMSERQPLLFEAA